MSKDRMIQSRRKLREVQQAAMRLYKYRETQYKDSWRDCSLKFLLDRLEGEYDEVINVWDKDSRKIYNELLDVALVAQMLAVRVIES